MIGGRIMDKRGNVKVAPKTGDEPAHSAYWGAVTTDKEEIELCLNCTRRTCKSHCDIIINYRKSKGRNYTDV